MGIKVDEQTGCMTFTTTKSPYPPRTINGKTQGIHRHVYEAIHGEIPFGMVVRHRCDNDRCFNPAHLEIGTLADNVRDMDERGRRRTVVNLSGPRSPKRKRPKWAERLFAQAVPDYMDSEWGN